MRHILMSGAPRGRKNPQLGRLTSGHSAALITAKAPAVHFFGSGALTLHSLVPSLLPITSARPSPLVNEKENL